MSKDKTPGNAPSDAEVDYRSNLMEQQRAYDEFMNGQRNTQAIMDSLPAAKNIHNFDLNMFSSPGTLASSIAKLESITIKGSTRFLYETSTQGTEARRGVQVINENVGSMAVFAADNVRLSLVKSMEKMLSTSVEDYNLFLSTYGSERIHLQYHIKGGVRNAKDVDRMIKGIDAVLRKNGMPVIRGGKGTTFSVNIARYLHRNGSKMPPEMRSILHDIGKQSANIKILKGRTTRLRAIRRFGFLKMRRYLQQTEAGYGAVFMLLLIRRSKSLIKNGLRAIKMVGRFTHWMALKAAKLAAMVEAHAVSSSIGQAVFATPVGQTIANVSQKGRRVANKGSRMMSRFGDARLRVKDFMRDPFHLKARGRAAGRRLADSAADRLSRTFLGKPIRFTSRLIFHPIRWIKNLIGTMISTVATVTSTVISVLLLMALALFGVCLIGFLLFTAASYLIALFDFSSTDEEIRKAALNQIRTCYEEQSRDIAQTRASYRKTNIYYNSVKDYALYNEHPPYAEFTETTNSVEMLSMATVYFNFDLEKAGKDKVCRYIEKLYNGSHETSIIPYTYTTVDANGNKISYTDADITLTTYYFPALFDCELKNKLGTISGTDVTEQVWNYFMSAGFTEEAAAGIMGNFYQESGCDPTCDGGAAAGICMFEKNTGYFGEMQAYAASKGKPWTDLQCQLDFMMMSLPSTFNQYTGIGIHYYDNGEWCWWPTPYSFEQFKQITDIDLATEMFERVYERASIPRMERRIEAAHNYYRMYKGTYSEELEEESENAPETESAS